MTTAPVHPWSGSPLAVLGPDAVALLRPHVHTRDFARGDTLLEVGAPATSVHFVFEGSVAVVLPDDTGTAHTLKTLAAPTPLGIASLGRESQRTATVLAHTAVRTFEVDTAVLQRLASENAEVMRLVFDLIGHTIDLLAESSARMAADKAELARLEEAHRQVGVLLIITIVTLSIYSIILVAVDEIEQMMGSPDAFKTAVMLAIAGIMLGFARNTGLPAAVWGLRWDHIPRQLAEATVVSAVLIGAATAVKAVLYPDLPLIAATAPDFQWFGWGLLTVYVVLVPLQEFIIRGLMQGSLKHFLPGRRGTALAILGSNCLFLVAHLNMSPGVAFLSAAGGLVWGAQYARHPSLVGVTVSHWMVGV